MQQIFGSRRRWIVGLALSAVMGTIHGPARAYTVRPEHPRIWLTPSTLTYLRSKAQAGTAEWKALKDNCDSYMQSTSQYDTSIQNNALVYQVTGDTTYANKAITLLMTLAQSVTSTSITRDSGYDVRTILPQLAIGYDWCYDRLTPDQRTLVRSQIEMICDWTWPETNPSRANAWSIDNPADNYYHGFMMTWLAGLAIYGDSPKAAGYIDHALQRWNGRILPFLEQNEAGGYLLEGTNYGTETAFRIFWYLSAYAAATGEDLLNAPGFDWPNQWITTELYLTTPTLGKLYPAGDQSRDPTAPVSDYGRMSALVAMSYLGKQSAGYARSWLDRLPSGLAWRWELWQDFLWYRDEVQSLDYTQTLPLGYLAAGAGWMTSRSDWTTQATQVYMMCGPTWTGHQDRAQNDFMIFHGDWLAAAARLNSHSGLLGETEFHNVLTIGDLGQPPLRSELPKLLPHVVHFEDTPRYAYFAGQAKDAYTYWNAGSVVPVLNDFYRQLLFLKPNQVVVFDRVDALDASQTKTWHLQTLNEPTIGADTYQTTVAGTTLFGKSLLPKAATIEKTPIYQGTNNALSSWRVDISAPTGSHVDYFLNVLEVAPSQQLVATPVLPVETGSSSLIGAQMGNQIVLFVTDPASTGSLTYPANATAAQEDFIVGLTPQAWYQISELSAAGTPLTSARSQASAQGVLTFPVTAAGAVTVAVALQSGGSTPAPLPAAPGGLTASVAAGPQVVLTWTNPQPDPHAYVTVWRQQGAGDWSRVALLPGDATTFTDTTVSGNASYTYRAHWVNGPAVSPWSNLANASIAEAPLAPPSGLTAAVAPGPQVTLTWSLASPDSHAYLTVWRQQGAGEWTRVALLPGDATRFTDTSVQPGTSYTYHAHLVNGPVVSAWSGAATVTTPSAGPAQLTASVGAGPQVTLTWSNPNPDAGAWVTVWRQAGSGEWTRVALLHGDATMFTDTQVTAGTSYRYRAHRVDGADVSDWSNQAAAVPLLPSTPSDLTASVVSPTEVDLTWAKGLGDETAVAIFRQAGSGPWQRLVELMPSATGYADRSTQPGTSYGYRVQTHDNLQVSAWSNEVPAATPQLLPVTVTNLTATVVSSTEIDLSWMVSGSGATGIAIWRQAGSGEWEWIAELQLGVRRYADRNLQAGVSYHYRMRADSSGAVSEWTGGVGGVTPAAP